MYIEVKYIMNVSAKLYLLVNKLSQDRDLTVHTKKILLFRHKERGKE